MEVADAELLAKNIQAFLVIKIVVARVTSYIRTLLMSGIKFRRNKD